MVHHLMASDEKKCAFSQKKSTSAGRKYHHFEPQARGAIAIPLTLPSLA